MSDAVSEPQALGTEPFPFAESPSVSQDELDNLLAFSSAINSFCCELINRMEAQLSRQTPARRKGGRRRKEGSRASK